MRGITIPWSKCNIFQKKNKKIKNIFYHLKKKTKKPNPLLAGRPPQWVASQPVYEAGGGVEHLAVDPGGVLGVACATPDSHRGWLGWLQGWPRPPSALGERPTTPMGGRPPMGFLLLLLLLL
jgi:hypothetical protein